MVDSNTLNFTTEGTSRHIQHCCVSFLADPVFRVLDLFPLSWISFCNLKGKFNELYPAVVWVMYCSIKNDHKFSSLEQVYYLTIIVGQDLGTAELGSLLQASPH